MRYALTDTATMFARCARRTLRSPDVLLLSLTSPAAVMFVFVYVFGDAILPGGGYLDYVVPGIMVLATSTGAAITATSVCADMSRGAIDRFKMLPMFRHALLAGHAAECVVRNLAAMVIVLVFAFIIGYRPDAGGREWLTAVGLAALYVLAVSWVAVLMGLLAKNPEAAGGLTHGLMFIPYVSSAFVPTQTMPSWLRDFAHKQPVTPVVDALRAQLNALDAGDDMRTAVLWCAGIAAVCYIAATIQFHRLARR